MKAGGALARLRSLAGPTLILGLALGLTSLAVWTVGENPLRVLAVLATSAFGSGENLSYVLFYAAPMILTGTAVALALQAGLFNIGAEGQLYMGAIAAAAWGVFTRGWFTGESAPALAVVVTVLGGILVSFAGGAFWGAIAGYLKAYRQTHEVIATIMLNFVAMAFVNWAILNPLKNPETQNPETLWIAGPVQIPRMWLQSTYGLPAALAVCALVLWALRKTWWGFRVRATGGNETAAALAGIDAQATELRTMALSGGVAGLAGFHEVFCNAYRLLDSFSPGYGFTGIGIALLARGSIPGLVLASLLFAALQKGSLDLDLETDRVTRDLSLVIQALILVALAARLRPDRRKGGG